MLEILRHRSFRHLFLAQVVALVGTGLLTVALALLAYDLAGANAGAVLGTALAIKMTVYVTLSPVAGAVVPAAWRKRVLVGLDLIRAAVALLLPFVTEIWQVYVLIALLQSSSACFTPLFQSLIPQILTEESDYTRALSLSRLAYDLESLLSPALAAALLVVISFHGLFAGTSVGFVLSALLVISTTFPIAPEVRAGDGPYSRALRGMRIYLHTPRLRGLLGIEPMRRQWGQHGVRKHGGPCPGASGWWGTGSSLGFGCVWRRLHGRCLRLADIARPYDGSSDHVERGIGDGSCVAGDNRGLVEHRRVELDQPHSSLGGLRHVLRRPGNTRGTTIAALGSIGRSTVPVCRPVLTLASMLASSLSAGGMAWSPAGVRYCPLCP